MLPEHGAVLLHLARGAIAEALGGTGVDVPEAAWLHEPGASFVTLMQAGELRGCIGTVEAYRPLALDVILNAQATALQDYRFQPLRPEELEAVDIEVSVLSPPATLTVDTPSTIYDALRPGVDGVILQVGARRATFLPQVWAQLPDPRQFVAELLRKAGAPDAPLSLCRFQRYTVDKLRETDF